MLGTLYTGFLFGTLYTGFWFWFGTLYTLCIHRFFLELYTQAFNLEPYTQVFLFRTLTVGAIFSILISGFSFWRNCFNSNFQRVEVQLYYGYIWIYYGCTCLYLALIMVKGNEIYYLRLKVKNRYNRFFTDWIIIILTWSLTTIAIFILRSLKVSTAASVVITVFPFTTLIVFNCLIYRFIWYICLKCKSIKYILLLSSTASYTCVHDISVLNVRVKRLFLKYTLLSSLTA